MKKSKNFDNSWWWPVILMVIGAIRVGLAISPGDFTRDDWGVIFGSTLLLLGGLRAGMKLGSKRTT